MSTENPVFQILTTAGNQAPLAKDLPLGNLKIGQIGIFNAHSNKSIDGTVPANAKDIYFAVGIGSAAAGQALEDLVKSSGQHIQVRNLKALTFKPYVASKPKIVEIGGFKAKCESDYALKIEFRSQQSYAAYGYNGLNKVFNYHTPCCNDVYGCDTCAQQGDNADLAIGLANAINADPDAIVAATFFANRIQFTVGAGAAAAGNVTFKVGTENFSTTVASGDSATTVAQKIAATINASTTSAYLATSAGAVVTIYPKSSTSNNASTASLTSDGGTSVTMTTISSANVSVTDTDAFRAANPGAGLAIRLTTSNGTTIPFNGNIPIKYYNAKETDIIVSLVDGFDCNGSVTTIQELQYEDGNGINLALDEYVAGGWNGKPGPYRTSAVTGLENGNYNSNVDRNGTYNVIVSEYDQFSVGGWQEFLNNLRTIIAIPCADGTTLAGLGTMLDAIFNSNLSDDIAANGDCTNAAITDINDYSLDGIEITA